MAEQEEAARAPPCSAQSRALPLRLLGKIRSDKSKARENQDTALKDNIRPSLLNYLPPFCHVSFAPELSAPTPPQPAPASSCSIHHPQPKQAQEQGSPQAPGSDPLTSFNTLNFPQPGQLHGHSPHPLLWSYPRLSTSPPSCTPSAPPHPFSPAHIRPANPADSGFWSRVLTLGGTSGQSNAPVSFCTLGLQMGAGGCWLRM